MKPEGSGWPGDKIRALGWSIGRSSIPVLKQRRADFRVCEALVLPLATSPAENCCSYLLLSKQGSNTHQAIAAIADFLNVPAEEIGYACSKDDDGITQQHLSVRPTCTSRTLEEFNTRHHRGNRWLHLAWLGQGNRPLSVGMTHGNNFRVNVRHLDEKAAGYLGRHRQITHYLLNYFDAQYFTGTPSRRTTEVRAASHWNEHLRALVRDLAGGDVAEVSRAGQQYTFTPTTDPLIALLRKVPAIPELANERPTVAQTRIHIGTPTTDDAHPHAFQCELSFFLPEGVYASSALAQLLGPVLDYRCVQRQ
ncbi:tRNA pseudouridine(13) synthase TruD [Streptomyces sp. NPDC059011]|uniref:tRNA pseudouridine(13) synthase TruD n=1 Tax=unclassified Streptomyces TaxID=2593676 RepID=UPI0036B10C5E